MDESDTDTSNNDMDIDTLLSRTRSKQELSKMLKVCLSVFNITMDCFVYYYGLFCIYY